MAAGTRDRLATSTIAQGAPLAAGYALSLAQAPVVINTLGISQFGVWALTGALAQYGALFDLGVSRSVTRFIALNEERRDEKAQGRTMFVAVAALGFVGVALVLLSVTLGTFSYRFFHANSSHQGRVLLLCASAVLIFALSSRVLASLSFGRGRMVSLSLLLAVGNVLMVGCGLIFVLAAESLEALAIGSAIGGAAGFVVCLVGVYRVETGIPFAVAQRTDFATMIKFGVKGQAVLVADLLVFQLSKIVLGIFAGPAATGVYELGSRLALGGRSFGSMASSVLLPRLTGAFSKGGEKAASLALDSHLQRTVCVAIFPLGLVISCAGAFSSLWVPSTSGGVALTAAVLSAAFVVNVASGPATVWSTAVGRPGVVAASAMSTAVANLALTFALVPTWGAHGAMVATGISVVAGALLGVILIQVFAPGSIDY